MRNAQALNSARIISGVIAITAPAAMTSISSAQADNRSQALGSGAVKQNVEPVERFIVRFAAPVTDGDIAWLESLGAVVTARYTIIPAVALEGDPAVIALAAQDQRIRYIEPDAVWRIFDEIDNTWGVQRTGAHLAHRLGQFGATVKVAVIDTGVDYTHPELQAVYAGGYDFLNNDPDPMDDNKHGTHVSGTIAAAIDGVGVLGMAPQVEIYVYKCFNALGFGNSSAILSSLQAAHTLGADVTNNSWGSFVPQGQAIEEAFQALYDGGTVNVAASGNNFGLFGVSWPARYETVIAVGAINQSNRRAPFSDNGPQLELAAPGVQVVSTVLNGGYAPLDGTSMASPHVAGAAALVIASGTVSDTNFNGRINDEVRDRLAQTAIDLGPDGRDNDYGFGLVNAMSAVNAPIALDIDDLFAGQPFTMSASGVAAFGRAYFVYGTSTGPIEIGQLGALLGIVNPALIGSQLANENGEVSLTANVPGNAAGARVVFQIVADGQVSRVITKIVN